MSVNVQQNGQLHQIAGSGGTSPAVEAKLAELEALIEQTRNLKADLENYGMVKLSNSSAVTENVGLALSATEKNPSINGTLASKLEPKYIDGFIPEVGFNSGRGAIYRCGNIVHMFMSISISDGYFEKNARQKLGTIINDIKPVSNIPVTGCYGKAVNSFLYAGVPIIIGYNGDVVLDYIEIDYVKEVSFQICYIAQ